VWIIVIIVMRGEGDGDLPEHRYHHHHHHLQQRYVPHAAEKKLKVGTFALLLAATSPPSTGRDHSGTKNGSGSQALLQGLRPSPSPGWSMRDVPATEIINRA
jgi:hypothetical protein